ncbi:hypothetical protein REPUB_Repub13aG0064500 [Reevesia pubescens]
MESKKMVIPIFCDMKPSELLVMDYGTHSTKQLQRFSWALEEAECTFGLTFDTLSWCEIPFYSFFCVFFTRIDIVEIERFYEKLLSLY